mgnify:CR=1 FL=1
MEQVIYKIDETFHQYIKDMSIQRSNIATIINKCKKEAHELPEFPKNYYKGLMGERVAFNVLNNLNSGLDIQLWPSLHEINPELDLKVWQTTKHDDYKNSEIEELRYHLFDSFDIRVGNAYINVKSRSVHMRPNNHTYLDIQQLQVERTPDMKYLGVALNYNGFKTQPTEGIILGCMDGEDILRCPITTSQRYGKPHYRTFLSDYKDIQEILDRESNKIAFAELQN